MKRYIIFFEPHQSVWTFSPIRTKDDVISIWMKVIKLMLINIKPKITTPKEYDTPKDYMVIHVDSVSRVYFISNEKIYSLNFPFFIEEISSNEEEISLNVETREGITLDSMVTSGVLSLIDTSTNISHCPIDQYFDRLIENMDEKFHVISAYRYLINSEDGYIRYDYDDKNQNGHKHPLNHLDIFYTNSSTFKLGLTEKTDLDIFMDILNPETNCHYVHPAK